MNLVSMILQLNIGKNQIPEIQIPKSSLQSSSTKSQFMEQTLHDAGSKEVDYCLI